MNYETKYKLQIKLLNALRISLIVLSVLIIVSFIGFEIYLWIHYGNMPKDQIPTWVWWWLLIK